MAKQTIQGKINPYTAADEQAIRDHLANLQNHGEFIERCERCGFDLTAHKDTHAVQSAVLQKVLDEFFPPTHKPPQQG